MPKARKRTSTMSEPRPACADQYFGHWLIQPTRLTERLEMFRAGALKPNAAVENDDDGEKKKPPYQMAGPVAIVPIHGEMMKGESSFGGTTSTVRVRRAIREAAQDSAVSGIMLHIDSPGGTVSGTSDLADDVVAARKIKPVHAHIADLGASAAYWVASQAQRITTNRTSIVGSLGTMATLVDESGALDKLGIKIKVVSTGDFKGNGADGVVTDEMVGETQRLVNDINGHFKAAVREGRGMTKEQADTLFDGRVHVGHEAQRLGLVDKVSSFDEAMETLTTEVRKMDTQAFAAYAAEHQDELRAAASGQIEAATKQAVEAATKAERERCAGIVEAFGTDAKFTGEQIASGVSVTDATVKHHAVLAAENAKLREDVAKAAKPLQAGVSFAAPVDEKPEPDAKADPKARAEWEYDNGQATWKSSSRENYVNSRVAELNGNLRISGRVA